MVVDAAPDPPVPAAGRALFLVELRAAADLPSDVRPMHQALVHAVNRLHLTGTAIRWSSTVLLPADSRCLCLIEAADQASVVLARDNAGLNAAVHRAQSLSTG